MKILLVSVNKEIVPYPVQPLGLMYLMSALLKKGHEVKLTDCVLLIMIWLN